MVKRKVRALVLLSGGLDSMLAAKVLIANGIEVAGVSFISNFFNAARAKKTAEQIGIDLITVDISKEIIELVKNPPSGHGKNLNPCLDCHALMIKKAGKIAKKDKYDFIATGEVLGQRPFSQNRQALDRVLKLAGVEVLRPLSAKLLPETAVEKKGLVDRNKLSDISGRTRERQMKMAKELGLEEYPSPAGGCLLTDPAFSLRMKVMIEHWPACTITDVELLKHGRVYWLLFKNKAIDTPVLSVVGRNQAENENLVRLAKKGDIVIELKEITGPTALFRILDFRFLLSNTTNKKYNIYIPEQLELKFLENAIYKNVEEILEIVCLLTGYYSTKARGKKVDFSINQKS